MHFLHVNVYNSYCFCALFERIFYVNGHYWYFGASDIEPGLKYEN